MPDRGASAPPAVVDLVVEACDYVVWDAAPFEVLRQVSLVIDGGRIVAATPAGEPLPAARRVMDGRRSVALPGFVNCHTHTAFHGQRGAEPEGTLDEWLPHVFAAAEGIGPAEAQQAARASYAEMLRAGFTSALDHHYAQSDPANALAVASAAAASGIRAAVAPTASDLGDGAVALDDGLARLDELATACARPGWERVSAWVALASPGRRESARRCRELREWARDHGARLTYHYAETRAWRALADEHGYERLADLLADLDLLGDDVVLAHGVWFEPDDFPVLAESGTWISYNPVSNGYLADGIAPIRPMLDAGVRICLGTDSVQSCGRADPFETMKVGALLQKGQTGDGRILVARDMLHLATAAGAAALGRPDAGVLAPGRAADLVLVDLDRPHLQPVHDVLWTIVYAASAHDVSAVVVDGEVLVETPTGAPPSGARLARSPGPCEP